MNLLRVIASMNPNYGGPSQGIRNSIPELEKFGVYNEVVSLDDPNSAFLEMDVFRIHALGPCKRPWCYSAKLLPWLLENMKRFDAIIMHGLWLYPSYAANRAIQILRTRQLFNNNLHDNIPKLFIMPHGMLDPYFQRSPDRKLKALRNWAYWKLIESKIVKSADGLLFTCEQELHLARRTFKPYQPKKEINVGYGIKTPPLFHVDMQKAFQTLCPEIREQPYILFLSRIHEKKGVDLLIKAYHLLKNRDISMPKLVIAGPGLETSYGKKIMQLTRKHSNLKNSVLFPGMLKGDSKWGAFYGCEAFILPSHQENFGIAIVEAMSCGKPVLISNQINIWREVDQFGCCIVSDDTQTGTLTMLERWKGLSYEEKRVMGSNARRCFENYFAIGVTSYRLMDALFIGNSQD